MKIFTSLWNNFSVEANLFENAHFILKKSTIAL